MNVFNTGNNHRTSITTNSSIGESQHKSKTIIEKNELLLQQNQLQNYNLHHDIC